MRSNQDIHKEASKIFGFCNMHYIVYKSSVVTDNSSANKASLCF